jgi:membrane protein
VRGEGERPHAFLPAPRLPVTWSRGLLDFLRRVVDKAEQDNIFFMAGAISFNAMAAIVPLVLFLVGVGGHVLQAQFGDPAAVLVQLLVVNLPLAGGEFVATVEEQINDIIAARGSLTLVGAVLLVWFSTRLVGTLRIVLREVFDIAQDRGIVRGKIFDAQVVMVGGALFVVNISVTAALGVARDFGIDVLGLQGYAVTLVQETFAHALAFGSIWVLFVGIYRFLPARRIPWRTALIAATFAAVLHEVLKFGFGFYATEVANYRTTYGNLITLAVLYFWIYYEAQVFILGGEFAQVWTMRRALRVRTRGALFEPGASRQP